MDLITRAQYDLMRVTFDLPEKRFGTPEKVFDAAAIGKSVALPRVSPDGRHLLFAMADYGQFFIWHKEADLYLMDLTTLKTERLPINSDEADSYHTWSSNGRWIVFASRRKDGVFTRPYFSYFDRQGVAHKPFLLPQKDPEFYDRLFLSYNVPEFVSSSFPVSPARLAEVARQKARNIGAIEINPP